MSETLRWAFFGDLQIPYEDKRAVALTLKVFKAFKPDAIDFVGDIDDQLEYSTYSDGTTDEFFARLKKEEDKDPLPFIKKNADGAKALYTQVRKQHKNADIHSSLGNHDIRVFNYVDRKCPEYNEQVTPETLWGLDSLGITWELYSEPPKERFAGIHVHHGNNSTSTGLAVRGNIEDYNISLVRGHDHRGGVVYKSYPMAGKRLVGMGCGHLCDPKQYGFKYSINHPWEMGFGIGHIYNGDVWLQFIPITKDYTCMVDGKLFLG